MVKFTKEVTKHKKNKYVQEKEIKIYRTDKKNFTTADMRVLYNGLINSGISPNKIAVKALGVDGWRTVKSYTSSFKDWDDEDYYAEKDIDADKFNSFFHATFYIRN
jgi:hypothetical protein